MDDEDLTSYGGIVASWGYPVEMSKVFGSYQGDIAFLLKDGSMWGWIVIGYGSCSGCDTIEALARYDYEYDEAGLYVGAELSEPSRRDLQSFSDSLKEGILWLSAPEMVDWLSNEEIQSGKWSWHEPGYPEFVAECLLHVNADG